MTKSLHGRHTLSILTDFDKNISSQATSTLRTARYSENILPKLYISFIGLWVYDMGNNIKRKYRKTFKTTETGCARIILQVDYRTLSAAMFQELEWLSIPKRMTYNKAVFGTHKILNNLIPAYISNLLKPILTTHNRMLRSSENDLQSIPRLWTALYDRSFSSSAPKLWNWLPKSIRTTQSFNEFKLTLNIV